MTTNAGVFFGVILLQREAPVDENHHAAQHQGQRGGTGVERNNVMSLSGKWEMNLNTVLLIVVLVVNFIVLFAILVLLHQRSSRHHLRSEYKDHQAEPLFRPNEQEQEGRGFQY